MDLMYLRTLLFTTTALLMGVLIGCQANHFITDKTQKPPTCVTPSSNVRYNLELLVKKCVNANDQHACNLYAAYHSCMALDEYLAHRSWEKFPLKMSLFSRGQTAANANGLASDRETTPKLAPLK